MADRSSRSVCCVRAVRCQHQHTTLSHTVMDAGKWGNRGAARASQPSAHTAVARHFTGDSRARGCPATGPSKQRLPGSRSINVISVGTSRSCLPPPVQKSKHSIPADGRPLVLTVSHWDLPWFRQQWHSTAPHRTHRTTRPWLSSSSSSSSSAWVPVGRCCCRVLFPTVLH